MNTTNILSGTWFTPVKEELEKDFDSWHKDKDKINGVCAILAPHAGYNYSGELAYDVYNSVEPSNYDEIIILSPSHRYPLVNKVSVEPPFTIENPNGETSFDRDLYNKLMQLPYADSIKELHKNEHSIYIQLPIIKHLFGHCKLGAISVGNLNYNTSKNKKIIADIACALRKIITPKTLLVISTDFTHYGKNFNYIPFTENIEENINKLDHDVFNALASNNNSNFQEIMDRTKATICGQNAMTLLLALLPKEAEFIEIAYANSAKSSQNYSHAVSYLGAVVKANLNDGLKDEITELQNLSKEIPTLSAEAAKQALKLTKDALEYAVLYDASLPIDTLKLHEELQVNYGAFVSLHKNGQLRGCIGEIIAQRPLAKVLVERAKSSALEDSRFSPVTSDELNDLEVEISILSQPEAVNSYNDIIIGKHGMILQKNNKAAVFLPQVAPEQGWNLDQTLTNLSVKAGLSPNAWQEGAQFFVFTAQIIK